MMEQQTGGDKSTVAVIGGGVAGIVAAHLLQKTHRVTLFEQGDYLGGHTHTITIPEGPDAGTPVDTGFIVFNEATYPHFIGFLAELGVSSRLTEMSFGFHCLETDFIYAGNTPERSIRPALQYAETAILPVSPGDWQVLSYG